MTETSPFTIYEYESVASTMDVALELWLENDHRQDDYVVWAHNQTAGRGQHGKAWQSMEGNLFATFVMQSPHIKSIDPHYVTILAGLATAQALQSFSPQASFQLKWPNDILIARKKVCGILIQREHYQNRSAFFIGVGVNLKAHPLLVDYPACNLHDELGVCIHPKSLIQAIMKFLNVFILLFRQKGFGPLKQKWFDYAFGLDSPVDLQTNEETKRSCTFRGIDNHARPLFEYQGEVRHDLVPQRIFWSHYY